MLSKPVSWNILGHRAVSTSAVETVLLEIHTARGDIMRYLPTTVSSAPRRALNCID